MASIAPKLSSANENTWMRLGQLSEAMQDLDKALYSYENALRHNPYNVKALTQIASICRMREQYPKAVEYFQRILNIENNNGEIWGALGHCYLMMDDLQKAYTAYQQALYHLPNPKDPNLWYGIGILYDRYGSFEHAEEAFTAVLKMDSKFEKSNEIYFRLGIIYKQQSRYDQALDCFRYILQKPPRPLSQGEIWFQIGHVHELQKDFNSAKDAYERVLKETPSHAKALQQLGWLYHSGFGNQDVAISYLMRSIDSDATDGQTWYLLGRCYMAQQQYRKAYDAYQQAVYRDGRNPTFWCSIGVLYYQINQYRDALDAYSRAIRLNPYLSEVWYDLGTLYESCNQISDSLDAYQRAAELDPGNKHIQQRLAALRETQSSKRSTGDDRKDVSKDKAPTTMEPRTTAQSNKRPRSPGSMSIPTVADLVDLSSDERRTLPSADDLTAKDRAAVNGVAIGNGNINNNNSVSVDRRERTLPKLPSPPHADSPKIPASDSKDSKDKDEEGMEIVEDMDDDDHKPEKQEESKYQSPNQSTATSPVLGKDAKQESPNDASIQHQQQMQQQQYIQAQQNEEDKKPQENREMQQEAEPQQHGSPSESKDNEEKEKRNNSEEHLGQ